MPKHLPHLLLSLSLLSLACSDSGTDTSQITPAEGGQAGASGATAGSSGQAGAGAGGATAGAGGATAGAGGEAAGQAGQGGAGAGGAGQAGTAGAGAGGSSGSSGQGQGGAGQAGAGGAAAGAAGQAGAGGGCVRDPGAADRERKVVVSHPYKAAGEKGNDYEVLTLSEGGTLAKTGVKFAMKTSTAGEIVFTPDGKLGFVPQEDGTLGVFSLAGAEPQVIDAGYDPGTYAGRLVMSPQGDRLYVLNDQWRENGGGVYVVKIGCDDTLSNEGLLAAGKLPNAMALIPNDPGKAFVASVDLLDSKAGDSAHVLSLSGASLLSSADAFGDADAMVSSVAVTSDGSLGFIADFSEFSGKPNRIAVLSISGDKVEKQQVIEPIENPYAMKASPFAERRVLVASGYGNALLTLKENPVNTPGKPMVLDGPLTYVGKKPQLPGDMVMIERGKLKGRVLVVEVDGLRQVQFSPTGGAVEDLGLFDFQGDIPDLPGAVGVQP